MEKKDGLSKTLAVIGAVLVGAPILAPVVFSLIRLLKARALLFDYLMPVELFPAVLVGGCLLLWAALRARSQRRWIGWSLGFTVASLAGAMALAEVTGLASGRTEPAGWPWAAVLAPFAAFWLALIAMDVGGSLLLRDLFRNPRPQAGSS